MRSCSATFVFSICVLSFPFARCQSSYEPVPIQDSDHAQTVQSDLLGISVTYPRSMVSVEVIQPASQDMNVPRDGVKNRGECLESIGNDFMAIRNMRTDDPDVLKRVSSGPEGAR